MRNLYVATTTLLLCLFGSFDVNAQEILLGKVKKADYFYGQMSVDGGSTVSTSDGDISATPVRVIHYYYGEANRLVRMVESDIMLGDAPETMEVETKGQEVPRTYTLYSYDTNGQLQNVSTRTYKYSDKVYGKRTWADVKDLESYEYNEQGKVVKKTDLSYVITYKWDGDNMIEEAAHYVDNGEWSYTIQYSDFVSGAKNLPQYAVRSDKWGVKYGSGDLIMEYLYENGQKVKYSEYKVADIVRDENNIITSCTKGMLYKEQTWTYVDGMLAVEQVGYWNNGKAVVDPSTKVEYTAQNDSIHTVTYTYNVAKSAWVVSGAPKVSVMGVVDESTAPTEFKVEVNESGVNSVTLSANAPENAATEGWNVFRNGVIIGQANLTDGKLSYVDEEVENGAYDYFIQHADDNVTSVVDYTFNASLNGVGNLAVVKNGRNETTKDYEVFITWEKPASEYEVLGYNLYVDVPSNRVIAPLNGETLIQNTCYKLDFENGVDLNHNIAVEAVYRIGRVSETIAMTLIRDFLPATLAQTKAVITLGDAMGLTADDQPAKADVSYYDAENKLVRKIHYSYVSGDDPADPDKFFKTGDWMPFQYLVYNYNEKDQLESIYQRDYGVYSGYNRVWDKLSETERKIYNEDGSLYRDSIDGRWYTYTYEGNNLVKEVYQTAYGNTVHTLTFSNFVEGKDNLPQYAFKSGITSSNNRIYEYVYDVDGNKIAAYTYKHDSETLVKDEEGNVISAEKGVPEFEEKWTYVDGVLTLYETNKWNTTEEAYLPYKKTEYIDTELGVQATSYSYYSSMWTKSGRPLVTHTVEFDGVAPSNLTVTDVEGKLNTVLLTAEAPATADASSVWNVFRDGVVIGQATWTDEKLTYIDELVANGEHDYFIQAADSHNAWYGVNISNPIVKTFSNELPAVTELRVDENGVNTVGDYSLKLSWDAPDLTGQHADLKILGYNIFSDVKSYTKNPSPDNGIYYFESTAYSYEYANTVNRNKTYYIETVYNIGKSTGTTLEVNLSKDKLPEESESAVDVTDVGGKLTVEGNQLTIVGEYISLEVYALNGVCVMKTSKDPTVDLSTLADGVYMARLNTVEGIVTVKIVKK